MTSDAPRLRVRFLIFSGRPDPEWDLDQEEHPVFLTRLAKTLQSPPAGDAPRGPLGYHGFKVRNLDAHPGMPPEVRVFAAVLTRHHGTSTLHNLDDGGVEEFLLAGALRRGYGKLLSAAAEDSHNND